MSKNKRNKGGARGISLVLALALAVTVQPVLADGTAPQPVEKSPYPDVAVSEWYCPFVAELSAQGAVSGYPDGSFGPQRTVTVGEALVMVLAAAGFARQPATGVHWSSGNADFALSKEFATAEQLVDLDAPVSRLTVAQMAAKALNLRPSRNESPFADTDDGYVTVLYEKVALAGEVDANGVRQYHPETSITRAELSAIVWRMKNTDVHAGQIKYDGYGKSYYLDVLETVPVFPYDKTAFVRTNGHLGYQTGETRARLGIDVSGFQGKIDWPKVKAAGVEFAIIRVGGRGYGSEGKLYDDSMWEQNIKGAQAAGLDVGVYFFSQAITVAEAQEEADVVLSKISKYTLTMPVVFDWELVSDSGARTNGMDNALLCQVALAFCDRIAEAGYSPMIYFNAYQGYVKYDLSKLMQYPFWFAQYQDQPNFYYDFQMWQYNSEESVDGIKGGVDMNLWFPKGS